MSASARRKIAAAQRARWAKLKAQQKKATSSQRSLHSEDMTGSGKCSQLAFLVISIFLWQQNRGHAAVRFRDDPDFGSAVKGVSRKQPKAVLETEFVFAVVVLVHVSPVSCDMSGEIPDRS